MGVINLFKHQGAVDRKRIKHINQTNKFKCNAKYMIARVIVRQDYKLRQCLKD